MEIDRTLVMWWVAGISAAMWILMTLVIRSIDREATATEVRSDVVDLCAFVRLLCTLGVALAILGQLTMLIETDREAVRWATFVAAFALVLALTWLTICKDSSVRIAQLGDGVKAGEGERPSLRFLRALILAVFLSLTALLAAPHLIAWYLH